MAISRERIFRVHPLEDSPHLLGSSPYVLSVRSKPSELVGHELMVGSRKLCDLTVRRSAKIFGYYVMEFLQASLFRIQCFGFSLLASQSCLPFRLLPPERTATPPTWQSSSRFHPKCSPESRACLARWMAARTMMRQFRCLG